MNVLTIDLETTTLDPWTTNILLIGYCYNNGEVKQIKVYNGEKLSDELIQALKDSSITKRGHNVHFDLLCVAAKDYTINGPLDDTRILSYLENPSAALDLKTLVETKLHSSVVRMADFGRSRLKKRIEKHPLFYSRLVKCGKYWVSKKTLEKYNIADVENCNKLRQELIETDWYRKVEQPLSRILFQMELRGIQLDIPYLKGLENDFKNKIEEYKKEFGTDFNANSPKQVKDKFKEESILLNSTDKYSLKQLSWNGNEFARKLLEYRGIFKLCTTYVMPFLMGTDKYGKIHGYFNQAGRETETYGDVGGTATGRLSSSNPNLQNIPSRTEEGKKIRKAFIATSGFTLIDSDLKQIEPRLIAHYSQSKVLLNAYEKGLDTHAIMGGLIFNKNPEDLTKMERFIGKTSWLATVYGCWYKKLRQIVEINSDEPVFYDEEFYKRVQYSFWQSNPEIRAWRERHIQNVINSGYLETIGSRSIKLQQPKFGDKFGRSEFERQAVNYLIQGSAADIMKMILVKLGQKWEGNLLAVIHDEVLAEIDKNTYPINFYKLNDIMCNTVKLNNVQIEADTKIIANWAEK